MSEASESGSQTDAVVMSGPDGAVYAVPWRILEACKVNDEHRESVRDSAAAEVTGFGAGFSMLGPSTVDQQALGDLPDFGTVASPDPVGNANIVRPPRNSHGRGPGAGDL